MRHPMHLDFDWNDAPNMRVPGAPAEARRGRSSAAGMPRIPEVDWSQAPNVRDSMRQVLHDAASCGQGAESCTCEGRPSGEQRTGDRASWTSAGQLGPSEESVSALDRAFQAPGARKTTTMRQVLNAMRAAGLKLNDDADDDEIFATRMLALVPHHRRGSASLREAGPDLPDITEDLPEDEPEAGFSPSDWFGVAEPACPKSEAKEAVWGRYDQIIADLRDMGAGSIRRCKWRDVYWGSIFPLDDGYYNGTQVPPPGEILEALRAEGGAVLRPFTELLLACRMSGIEFAITPFDAGGGSTNNVANEDKARRAQEGNPLDGGDWVTVYRNRPGWQLGVRVPSSQGWDEFYWKHGHVSDDMKGEQEFQRFALQVWPTRLEDAPDSSSYTRECARRKSLAIAAFCQGIAEHLQRIHFVWLRMFGNKGIHATVSVVELGNELDGLFESDPATVGEDVVAEAQYEAGRYMELVASPFRALLPAMRFRAAELSSWGTVVEDGTCHPAPGCCVTDPYETRLQWLRDTIGIGVVAARNVDMLYQSSYASYLSSGGSADLPDETAYWALSCAEAHYWWPPQASEASEVLTFTGSSLVHEVGLHWYHGYDRKYVGVEYEWIPGYQDAIRLQSDLDLLESVVVAGLRDKGFTLTRTAGEVAFAGIHPDPVDTLTLESPYYTETNTLLQAGMLARFLFQFRTAGVSRMSWFCPLLNPLKAASILTEVPIPSNWSSPAAGTGLHNDIGPADDYDEFARLHAWRRPAWFTYRRVAWLLSLAVDGGSLQFNARGLTVLRYRLRAPLSFISGTSRTYRFLWVAWLDQYSDSECLHEAFRPWDEFPPDVSRGFHEVSIVLYDTGDRGYERISLVPFVEESEEVDDVDANGFRQASDRNWFWEGWDGGLTYHAELYSRLYLHLRKSGTDVAQAPLAVLTDAATLEEIRIW